MLREWEKLPKFMQTEEVRPYYDSLKKKKISLALKRGFDVFAASVMLVTFSPVLITISIMIVRDSKGGVFYRQERVTQYGRKFKIFKFRTMVANADKIGTQVTVSNDSNLDNPIFYVIATRTVIQLGVAIPFFISNYKGTSTLWKKDYATEVHQYVEGSYTIFPAQEVAEQTEGLTGYQMSLFDIMSNSEPEEITEEPEVEESAAEVEEIQNEEPEADPHMSFEEAKELWEDGFYEDDYVLKSRVGELIYDSMDTVGKSVEDFSEEQMAVIRKLAEQERMLEPVLNPDFSPEQMQLVSDISEKLWNDNGRWQEDMIEPYTDHVMNPEEITRVRQELDLQESESEPEDVVVQEQWDEDVFEYQGYHFEAVGVLPQGLEGKELVNQTREIQNYI